MNEYKLWEQTRKQLAWGIAFKRKFGLQPTKTERKLCQIVAGFCKRAKSDENSDVSIMSAKKTDGYNNTTEQQYDKNIKYNEIHNYYNGRGDGRINNKHNYKIECSFCGYETENVYIGVPICYSCMNRR